MSIKINPLFALGLLAVTLITTGCGNDSSAASKSTAVADTASLASAPPALPVPSAPKVEGRAYILLDPASGQVLAAANEDERLEPASLTKIMTAYAVFDALRAGSLKLTDPVTISEHAWREGGAATEGSTSFLPVNSQAPVEVLLRGMIIQSGNDASIALAERVGGSEAAFAQLMNAYAKRLGMSGTHYENATGLPGPNHYTTAHDMALLSAALIREFPQYYHYFSEKEYTFNKITQHNRNGLLTRDPSVDGLKTGHTQSAGFCLATSAQRNGMRLVSVVMGTGSVRAREDSTAALLNYGFNFFESKPLIARDQVLGTTRVWKGKQNTVSFVTGNDIVVTVPRGRSAAVEAKMETAPSFVAPLGTDAPLGKVNITLDGKVLRSAPVYAQASVAESGFFGRLYDAVLMKFE